MVSLLQKSLIKSTKSKSCLLYIFLITFCVNHSNLQAQNPVFATTVSSQDHVINSTNSIDGNLLTSARVEASSGILLGIGAYNGHIELEFPTTLPANTTSYVKLETEDNLLDVLLSGQLGGLLSDVLGTILIGNQEFTIQAKNNNTIVLEGQSQIQNDFAGAKLKIVKDSNNNKYISITPDQPYNKIRIINRIGSLLGLNNIKNLWVHGAFYYDNPSLCGQSLFTSFSGSGLSLDLLGLGGAGVQNPHHVIDNDINSYSKLSLGILAVAASIEQTVYFQGLSNTSDSFIVRMKVDPSLLALGVANNIQIIAHNGPNIVQTVNLSSLLNVDLLTLLAGNQVTSIPFTPNQAVDRVTVKYNSLLNIQLTQSLDLYDIIRIPQSPTIDLASQNTTICSGNSASLIAISDPTTLEIRWYDAAINGNLVGTTQSGQAFVTPVINNITTFYVAAGRQNCLEESLRIPVTVNINQSPTANDINVTGNTSDICAIQPVILTPSSTISNVFNWYFTNDYSQPITNGMTLSDITFTIDTNGVLTINGLSNLNSPYTFFVSVTNETTSCNNLSGDLKAVQVSIIDASTPTTTNTAQEFCVVSGATIAQLQTNENNVVWYNVPSGGTPLPNTTLLVNNGIYYATLVGSNGCESSSRLMITVTLNDVTPPTTTDTNQEFCVVSGVTVAQLQTNETNVVWYNVPTGGSPLQSTLLLVDNGIYYAALVGTNGCESSNRLVVTVDLDDTPAPTTNDTSQEFCITSNATVSQLQANGNNMVWYNVPTGGTALPSTTLLVDNGIYYGAQIGANGCESSSRLIVTVDLDDTPAPTTTNTTQEFCVAQNATVAQLQTNESNVLWYNTPSGGIALASTTLLTNNGVYYAVQVGTNGCESSDRLMVTVNLNDTLPPTTTDTTQEFCVSQGATISQLQVNESNILWYDVSTGGTALTSSTVLINNGNYYAVQIGANGCESSNRLLVSVTLNDTPPPTTNDTMQEFCITSNATVSQLQANGTNINWYNVPTGGSALAGNTPLVDNATYYATQTGADGCESSVRLMVTVDILSNSIAAITPTNSQICFGNTNTYTTASGMTNYQWVVTGGTILNGGGNNDTSVTVQWNSTTGTQVSVTYNDPSGCGGLATTTFTETLTNCSDLVIEKSVDNSTPTPGETVHFTITVNNDGNTIFSNIEVLDILPSGYNFVSATTSSGSYNPNTGIWLIPTIIQNGQASLIITVTVNGTGNYLNIATITNSNPIDVDLTNNTDDATVTIECFTVYNEFSPNDDGVNDYFEIDCVGNYNTSKIEIFNRYGNVVFKKSSYNNDWNGVANVSGVIKEGEALPAGTYFYILTIDEINFKKTGWVYIAK